MPIVVGVGRSGTTLVRLMLDAHRDIALPGETGFLLPILDHQRQGRTLSRDDVGRLITGFHTWPDLGMPAEVYLRELSIMEPFTVSDAVRLYFRLYASERGKHRWGDKTPVYGQYLPEVEQVLPEAHFVHVIRDGRDVAASLRHTWFAPSDDAGELARHWVEQVTVCRQAGASVSHYLEIRYEDLVTGPEAALRRVCDFTGLGFDPTMLTFFTQARTRLSELRDTPLPDGRLVTVERRLENHRWTSTPPDPSRIGRWREEFGPEEQRAFAVHATELLAELGYDPT